VYQVTPSVSASASASDLLRARLLHTREYPVSEDSGIALRIVLADDHEVVRAGLRALVDANPDMRVVGEARDGAEAVRKACELLPDVLVMDVSMPVLDGAQATEQVQRECAEVRVLALTMHEDRGHLARLLEAGAAGYVLKRAAADELVRAIRTVAAGGTYVDPVLAGAVLRAAAQPARVGAQALDAALSEREEEVLRRIAWGHSNKQIGTELGISTKTVETYKARIIEKLGLRTRTEMVRYAVQKGWLAEE
jgi:DNA-binding NarL/FixJ family response regulator